jgi:cation transport ATPase
MAMPANREHWTQSTAIVKQMSSMTMLENPIVAVQPGEVIPVDGVITEGVALINEQNLTRLAKPSTRMVGDQVFASTILLAGKVNVKIVRNGEETAAMQLDHLLTHAEASALACQTQSEEIATAITAPLLGLGVLATLLFNPIQAAALVNARLGYDRDALVTTKALAYLNVARQQGILIKDCQVLQALASVDTILFDIDTTRRPDIGEAIRGLRQQQVPNICLLSRVHANYASRLAARAGVDAVYPVATPADGAQVLERLWAEGRRVCYVHSAKLTDERLYAHAVVTVAVGDLGATGAPAQVVLLANDFTQISCLLDLGRKFAVDCRRCEQLTFWPGAVSMASTLFLGTGLLVSVLLNDLAVIVGADPLATARLALTEQPKSQTDVPGYWQALANQFPVFNSKVSVGKARWLRLSYA